MAITHAMADGEESVAGDIETITLASAGSITLTLPAATAGTDAFNIYCTTTNGKVLQKYSTVAAATASVDITAEPQGRQLRDRAFLKPLPAGTAICFHGGRLRSLSGEFIYYSKPHDYGVYDPAQDYIVLGRRAASRHRGVRLVRRRRPDVVLCRCGHCHGRPRQSAWRLARSQAQCSTIQQDTSPVAGWYSDEGVVFGAGDGSVTLPQRANGFIAPTADTGATWVRQRNGQAHVVVGLDGTAAYDSKVSDDFTTARMRYDDDSTTVCMELTGGATSRYSNWHFNSYATFDGEEYGMDSVGLRLLDGADDEGDAIEATIDLGLIGYDSPQIKSPDSVYVRGKSSDALVVDIALPDEAIYSYESRSL
ncbi:MAG: hypothetical protein IPK44_24800 [Candidatus Accumulibacter sp.]|uniref:hypothetical protein n=1 Tax=Accumulibacter sp. TaxID=2053492 RepID=UPI00258CA47C|nr:hypothetical protein [Accumulibacter sp.]MBK8117509.1 hypothetical protein [Accumulibacter sp.]